MSRTVKKGFTLIELLIVIVVIGILSVGMFIAASEMEATAKAAKIINDLKQLKTAVTAWYWDTYGTVLAIKDDKGKDKDNGYKIGGTNRKKIHEYLADNPTEIKKYLSNNNFSLNQGRSESVFYAAVDGYSVYSAISNTRCYVVYRLSNDTSEKDKARLREKLKSRAKSAGLVSYYFNSASDRGASEYNGGNFVFMLALMFEEAQ